MKSITGLQEIPDLYLCKLIFDESNAAQIAEPRTINDIVGFGNNNPTATSPNVNKRAAHHTIVFFSFMTVLTDFYSIDISEKELNCGIIGNNCGFNLKL